LNELEDDEDDDKAETPKRSYHLKKTISKKPSQKD